MIIEIDLDELNTCPCKELLPVSDRKYRVTSFATKIYACRAWSKTQPMRVHGAHMRDDI